MGSNRIGKKILVCLMIACVLFSITGCGAKKSDANEKEKTEAADTTKADSVKIDYKTSELYTKEDMDDAITVIMKEFDTWDGCEMHEISYTDDQMCKDNISYVNELDPEGKYEDCIIFTSSFHSPEKGGGAWEADYEYEGWQWYLARSKDGEWHLLTWGY